jgi:hypothetical protein
MGVFVCQPFRLSITWRSMSQLLLQSASRIWMLMLLLLRLRPVRIRSNSHPLTATWCDAVSLTHVANGLLAIMRRPLLFTLAFFHQQFSSLPWWFHFARSMTSPCSSLVRNGPLFTKTQKNDTKKGGRRTPCIDYNRLILQSKPKKDTSQLCIDTTEYVIINKIKKHKNFPFSHSPFR